MCLKLKATKMVFKVNRISEQRHCNHYITVEAVSIFHSSLNGSLSMRVILRVLLTNNNNQEHILACLKQSVCQDVYWNRHVSYDKQSLFV